jgi:glycosyltransferase involved in cell wall biosynthesis
MKIAQIAPLYESVPPTFYGGTERVVSYLTDELVRQGHDVTLYASADSNTLARLRPMCEKSLRLRGNQVVDSLAHHICMLENVAQEAKEFDLLHFHIDYLHFPLTRRLNYASVTTLHGRLDIPDIHPLFREFSEMNLVSISNAQREPMKWANWAGTVYHGLPKQLYAPNYAEGSYLAFLGRISPEKRVDRAIEIAEMIGVPIKIAAKIDAADKDYFESEIKGLLHHSLVEYVGEIGEHEKAAFIGGALALMFLIDWQEPFGMVLIEAMACGTPVIAYRMGSVPEVVDDGVTGYIVDDADGAAKAVSRIHVLDRRLIRNVFENRFSAQVMCKNYIDIYERVRNTEPHLTGREPQPSAA